MPKTNAEYQAAWRRRRAERMAGLEAEAAQLRAELAGVRGDLAAALADADGLRAEIGRLTGPECRHPAEAVDGSYCTACRADIW